VNRPAVPELFRMKENAFPFGHPDPRAARKKMMIRKEKS
jgi:hypothetical protein